LTAENPHIPSQHRPVLRACPICGNARLRYAFSVSEYRLVRCTECHFLLLNPQPSDAELRGIYHQADGGPSPTAGEQNDLNRAVAQYYLDQLRAYRGVDTGRLLHLWIRPNGIGLEARSRGYDVVECGLGVDVPENEMLPPEAQGRFKNLVDALGDRAGEYDVCILTDTLEHVRDPVLLLKEISRLIKPDAPMLLAVPALDSWSGRLLKQRWMEFKPEHLTYFDSATLQSALFQAGFHEVTITPDRRPTTLNHVRRHFDRFEVPLYSALVRTVTKVTPDALRDKPRRILASGLVAIARPRPDPQRRRLTVIVPAFNEAATFRQLMDSVVEKQIPGLEMEIIVVESGSTDGTREIAQSFAAHSRVRVVLQDHPRGKGNAVRAGLALATGEFILIQDADLEYDLDDYDALLEPLLRGTEAFVLGSRHGGSAWKMRRFERQRLLSEWLNFGHWFFTTLINLLFRQRLRDPFTMFKVFRRDCLHGLEFQCERFDFDIELLVKLVRKGYKPIEIPVNYRSRSFKEGKKVSMLRDPFTWLGAMVRLRLQRVRCVSPPRP